MKEKNNFDQYAKDYISILSDSVKISGETGDYFSRFKIAELAKHEDREEAHQILDFGCGEGNTEYYFKEFFPVAKIFGIDISPKCIEAANQKGIEGINFVNFDGENVPFGDKSFDLVFTSMVFHHIPLAQHRKILDEIWRVLKPGGRFYLFEHNPQNIVTRRIVEQCVFDKDAILINSKQMAAKLSANLFENIKITFTLFFPRNGIFKLFHPLEKILKKIPFGAQYYVKSRKPF